MKMKIFHSRKPPSLIAVKPISKALNFLQEMIDYLCHHCLTETSKEDDKKLQRQCAEMQTAEV